MLQTNALIKETSIEYEIKVILIALAKHAINTDSKEMYEIIADMANAEGVVLESWDKAKSKNISD